MKAKVRLENVPTTHYFYR